MIENCPPFFWTEVVLKAFRTPYDTHAYIGSKRQFRTASEDSRDFFAWPLALAKTVFELASTRLHHPPDHFNST